MTAQTHPWTFICPKCGKPAFHSVGIPMGSDPIDARAFEYLDGSTPHEWDPVVCQSCSKPIQIGYRAPILDAANWVRRDRQEDVRDD